MLKRLMVIAVICLFMFVPSSAFAKAQDIIKMNKEIEVDKDMVVGDVVAIGGDVAIAGRVENNVVAVGGSVTLKDHSYVGGHVVVVGGEIYKSPSAVVSERITQIYMPRFIPSITTFMRGGWMALWTTISILVLLGFIGLAILFTALIPEHIGAVISTLEKSFVSMLLWGMLWAILVVPIAVFLAMSIIGIVLIPLEILLAILALIIGYIASAVFIGKHILASFAKKPPPFVDAILGIMILFLIGFVPMVGPIVKMLFVTAGFGAVLTTRFGTIK